MNKRGVSAVVAAVMMILITVAAIVIIWLLILPMVKDISSFEKITDLAINTIDGYTFWDVLGQRACIQAERGIDEIKLYGVMAIFSIDGNSYLGYFNAFQVPNINEARMDCFNLEGLGKPKKVSIAPIYERGIPGSITSSIDRLRDGNVPPEVENFGGVEDSEGDGTDGIGDRDEPGACVPDCEDTEICSRGVCVTPSCGPLTCESIEDKDDCVDFGVRGCEVQCQGDLEGYCAGFDFNSCPTSAPSPDIPSFCHRDNYGNCVSNKLCSELDDESCEVAITVGVCDFDVCVSTGVIDCANPLITEEGNCLGPCSWQAWG